MNVNPMGMMGSAPSGYNDSNRGGGVLVPMVIERTNNGERSMDIFSKLLDERIIFLTGEVEPVKINIVISQMLYLNSKNQQPIHLYIDSPGGSVHAGLALHDTMRFIKAPVYTYVFGLAASMGSFIANAGEAGHRYVLPESTTMIHRLSTGVDSMFGNYYVMQLQREDAEAGWKHSEYLHHRLTTLYQKYNSKGKAFKQLEKGMKVNNFLTAQQAIDWGLADKIIEEQK